MIDDVKPYPAMNDSDVPWLGAVPEHWEAGRREVAASKEEQACESFR